MLWEHRSPVGVKGMLQMYRACCKHAGYCGCEWHRGCVWALLGVHGAQGMHRAVHGACSPSGSCPVVLILSTPQADPGLCLCAELSRELWVYAGWSSEGTPKS